MKTSPVAVVLKCLVGILFWQQNSNVYYVTAEGEDSGEEEHQCTAECKEFTFVSKLKDHGASGNKNTPVLKELSHSLVVTVRCRCNESVVVTAPEFSTIDNNIVLENGSTQEVTKVNIIPFPTWTTAHFGGTAVFDNGDLLWRYSRVPTFRCRKVGNVIKIQVDEGPPIPSEGKFHIVDARIPPPAPLVAKPLPTRYSTEYAPPKPKDLPSKGCGDPHFTSWGGVRFDFHGECDLVLATSKTFGKGLGLDLHIRTAMVSKASHPYSYISEAAIRIGNQVLSVDRERYWLDGMPHAFEDETVTSSLSGYNIHVSDSETKKGKFMKKFVVDLGDGHSVTIKSANSHIDVSVDTGGWDGHFEDLVGLLGRHRDRSLVDRNGHSMEHAHANDIGQMWQVREWEDMIFPQAVGPQHPAKCNLPPPTQTSRHLRSISDTETLLAAEVACGHIGHSSDRDNCVFDVLATGDIEMADFYDE